MTTGAAPRITIDRLRAALGRRSDAPALRPPTHRHAALEQLYPGREVVTALGACFVVEWELPLSHRHGAIPLHQFNVLDSTGVACLTRSSEAQCPQAPLFLDTETTGLSGGTGTFAFLIGLGWIERERLIIRQFLMRDYDEEPALLQAVAERLVQHDALVTYNGKSFDQPLMETRFVAARRETAPMPAVHLDLLHPTRRLLRDRLERCTLSDVERGVLGHSREGDLPGWMIPSVYFQYVREADPRLIGGVLEHNRDDILSLVALAGWLGHTFQAPLESQLPPVTLNRVAVALTEQGRTAQAMAVFGHVVATATVGSDERADAALRLARLQRSEGQGVEAERHWRLAADHPRLGPEALVALAKYLEHERRDFAAAREIVERALVQVQLRAHREPSPEHDRQRAELEHRLARINRRAAPNLRLPRSL